MRTDPLMTFESYYEQIKDFDLLGLPPNPDCPRDISAKNRSDDSTQVLC